MGTIKNREIPAVGTRVTRGHVKVSPERGTVVEVREHGVWVTWDADSFGGRTVFYTPVEIRPVKEA